MKEGMKQFLIRGIIFILLLLLVFPYIRHFFVHATDQINVIYYTERISLIVGIAFVILFFMLKENLPEVKEFNWKNLLFAILALALFFSTFMLEADFDSYMKMGLVHVRGNHADIGGGWILGESISINAVELITTPVEKQIILDNTSNVQIRWYGVWYSWNSSWNRGESFRVTMLVNNNSNDITPEYRNLNGGNASWMELNVSEEQLVRGVNNISVKAEGNENYTRVLIMSQFVYHDNMSSPPGFFALLYAASPHDESLRTLLNFTFLIKILAIAMLFIAVFGAATARSLIIRKESIFAILLSYIVYFLSFRLQEYWLFFSTAAAKISYFLLRIISSDAYLQIIPLKDPYLGIAPFIVGISKMCSGIEGLAFFAIMSALIVLIDWKKTSMIKALILIPLGMIGMLLVNSLRITSIILIGRYINPKFATSTFHTNIGWIVFILYFVVFWYFAYGWLVRKK
jgi:exosortase/archaeosortase family protein